MSEFLHWDLGLVQQGDVVEVTLTAAAYVRLMSRSDYRQYRNGGPHQYYGGYVTASPHAERVPRSGRWFVAVDTRGLRNATSASVRVIPGATFRRRGTPATLPVRHEGWPHPGDCPGGQPAEAARSASQRAEVEEVFRAAASSNRGAHAAGMMHDLFIAHAAEDATVVRELAQLLAGRGVEAALVELAAAGGSLRSDVERATARSRFGLIVLSPALVAADRSQHELDGLVTSADDGRQIVVLLRHRITKDEVVRAGPRLGDRVALTTATSTIDEIAEELASSILARRRR